MPQKAHASSVQRTPPSVTGRRGPDTSAQIRQREIWATRKQIVKEGGETRKPAKVAEEPFEKMRRKKIKRNGKGHKKNDYMLS